MSRRSWAYIGLVILAGAVSAGLAFADSTPIMIRRSVVPVMIVLATLAQLVKVRGPSHEGWHVNLIFFLSAALLLHPALYVVAVVTSHLVEWAKERLAKSTSLRNWYIQPFNIAAHIIAGYAARLVYVALSAEALPSPTIGSLLGGAAAGLTYAIINHVLIGQALVLARSISWRDSGVLDVENLLTDIIMLILGYVVALLWTMNPWLILPALSPLELIRRALTIPQLKKQADTDPKTGLWNAAYFGKILTTEVERAERFDRSLAVIMADLDLLRNINNTYGHLAGDAVLVGIAHIIRDTVRQYDTPSRFGGEEFAIVLPEADMEQARDVAERLREAIECASFATDTTPSPIGATMSFGVACFPSDAKTPKDLVHEADVAVYQAKLQGRNRVVCTCDVPHFVDVAQGSKESRLHTESVPVYTPRPTLRGDGVRSTSDTQAQPIDIPAGGEPQHQDRDWPKVLFRVFVGLVIAAGLALTVRYFDAGYRESLTAVALLAGLGMITQLPQVKNLYGDSSVSVSVAMIFAAGIIAGFPGVAAVSATVVAVHAVRARPAPYKIAFNWATHVLAGSMSVIFIHNTGPLTEPMQLVGLLQLALSAIIAALAYFAIETGLIAIAISFSKGMNPIAAWRLQYMWMTSHYVVLCVCGLFLSIANTALGPIGIVVFTMPVLMMHLSQKQYLARSRNSVRELERMNRELSLANQEVVASSQAIQQLNDELFVTLAKIIDARDPFVHGHASKVADYAIAIATELGLPAEHMGDLRQAALLHDIGKIGISEQILHKPGKLSREEYEIVKAHAPLGASFLYTCQGLRHLAPFVGHHHERWDGRGYPDRLQGEDIPLEARVLAICDAVEAMASDRPYHGAMSLDEIVLEVKRCAGTQFDPSIAEAFVRVAERQRGQLIVNSAREVVRAHADADSLLQQSNDWLRPRLSPAPQEMGT